jgi:hypothetical protein
MRVQSLCVICVCLAATACRAATLSTGDGLRMAADLPAMMGEMSIDGTAVSHARGGMSLIDPRTGKAPEPGAFQLTVRAEHEAKRVIVSGVVTAAGDKETVCQLQAVLPVGGEGWLFWDDMTRSRAVRLGEAYVQSVYPICCVTDAARRLGVAVGVDPDPLQPTSLYYDPASKAIIVNWFFGFTPLGRPEYRMRAPFRIEIYRVLPGWAFRSALDRYYGFHPREFDWRAKHEGLWLFASASESLPNPQHYAYDEGGPPPTADIPRGIFTFPYSCAGDLIIALPPEWGVPKTYDEMLDRLKRYEQIPRLVDWEQLSPYDLDKTAVRAGARSLKLSATATGLTVETRQVVHLDQKKVDPVTFSVWTKAQDVTGGQDSDYSMWLDLVMADGTNQFGQLVQAAVGTHDWQQLKITVGADQPIATANLYLLFRQTHTGTAWFDDVSATAASQPDKNLVLNPGFEDVGKHPELDSARDNVMYDENDHMRYFPDTWGGADVPPSSPINWIRFILLVQPDQRNTDGVKTASEQVFDLYDGVFRSFPACRGAYLDGTSGSSATSIDYRRDHFACFNDPFQYVGTVYRPVASAKGAMVRWVQAFRKRYGDKLAFGNVWASNTMFPLCMALDVCGYESSRWYDLDYADYYRAAAYHKPGLYLNYFRIGQQLDTREGGERFFRYSAAYGIFPSIGRFTDEAYEKFGDLQHLYIPIVKQEFRAGWEPVTYAEAGDPVVRVQRFGTKLPMYFTLLNPEDTPREVSLKVDTAALGLRGTTMAAVEMVTSAALPLKTQAGSVQTIVALGPRDTAVVALLPTGGVGAWFRERAAEILDGAACVYAHTPPTVKTADLAKTVKGAAGKPAQIAKALDAVKTEIEGLRTGAAQLPDDLKRRSYLRELAEATRLINEALLADAGARVGWGSGLVAPVDGTATLSPAVLWGSGMRLTNLRAWAGWIVEPPAGNGTVIVGADGKVTCPTERAITAATDVEFTDAAGAKAALVRRAHAFFGRVCELRAQADATARALVVRVRNSDTRARTFKIDLDAPQGIGVEQKSIDVALKAGETRELRLAMTYAPDLRSGTYYVKMTARTEAGAVAEEGTAQIVYVLPLEADDLALAAQGAHVAVDSAFYAYSEKPVNDGVVNPVGVAFNEAAWASGETDVEHWAEVQLAAPRTVSRVVIYWNVENEVVWTARHFLIQVKDAGAWKTVGEYRPDRPEPVTACTFAAVNTGVLRVLQPKGDGPATRPNLMWLREIAVYEK